MKMVRKVMNAFGTAAIAVLDTIFFYKPGAKPVDWPTNGPKTGTSPVSNTGLYEKGFLYMTHEERGQKLQADSEDRRRRGQDQYIGYNW